MSAHEGKPTKAPVEIFHKDYKQPDTGLVLELEHLKIETRLISERFVNVMGECEN
jgi:hypothetical protein